MENQKIRILTIDNVKQILTMKSAISLVETAFREKGLERVQMPPKPYLYFKKHDGDLRIMPAYLEELDEAGVKTVSVYPHNPKRYDLPTVLATILLFDPKSGAPTCIMDGTWVTAMRTAAACGVATKYLARKNAKTVGIIGAGYQAPFQIEALNEVVKVESVEIFDTDKKRAEKLAKETKAKIGVDTNVTTTAEDTVRGSDILVTITPVKAPIVKNEWIAEGMHINAIGADASGKEEYDPKILKRAKIVIDDWEQASHSGEINVPFSKGIISKADIHAEIGEIVAGTKLGRVSKDEITVFDSTGLAIQDVITAWHVYNVSKKKDIGKKLKSLHLTRSTLQA